MNKYIKQQFTTLRYEKNILVVEGTTSAGGCGLFNAASSYPASVCLYNSVAQGFLIIWKEYEGISLEYTYLSCGTPLGYEGLCWKCECEQERQAALARTPEQIVEKQRNLIQNIQRLADMEDPKFADFWQLLGYHDVITPETQRIALVAEVPWPCEIYYHASVDVRDGLIRALLSAEYSSAVSNLISYLAMQGDDKAIETLLELERNLRPWRKGLCVDPPNCTQIGGQTFNKEGREIQLNLDTCYPTVKGAIGEKSPVRIGREREDTCPHCGGRIVDILVLDGRNERLESLGLGGILTATCCSSCVGFFKGSIFNRFILSDDVEVLPSELFDDTEKTDCYVSPEEYKALTESPSVLGKAPVPLFYGAAHQNVNTIGGFANQVQDAEYTVCPRCGKPMRYLAQIQWDMVFDCAEGTLYVEFCPDCHIMPMQHQRI